MEIERKFLVSRLPDALDTFPRVRMEQAYICTDPVLRIRRAGERYVLTCKGRGLLAREEFELELSPEAYARLLPKTEGVRIVKDRYEIPLGAHTVELDIFHGTLAPLVLAEVEFPTEEAARAFAVPDWFVREVTFDPAYTNAALSRNGLPTSFQTRYDPKNLQSVLFSAQPVDLIESGRTGNCVWNLSSNGVLIISGKGAMQNYARNETKRLWGSARSVIIEQGVTSIGNASFWNFANLTDVHIPESVNCIGIGAFHNCKNLTNVKIPNGVISIGDYAFFHCRHLTSVNIPDSVISVGISVFSGCTGLTSVQISNSLTTIGRFAFRGCPRLKNITVPASLDIKVSAFDDNAIITYR